MPATYVCSAPCSQQPPPPPLDERRERTEHSIDALFFASYNANKAATAIAIVKDGKVVLSKGYGTANLEYGIPITPGTVFHVASVSKQFTAFAIYLLEKQGKVSLEDDIRKYVPELPDLGRPIQLRHPARPHQRHTGSMGSPHPGRLENG
ncbi:MAG: serine hydrolase domain-containing protein [Paludibaculum sp.]